MIVARFMLDTNILSDIQRNPFGAAAKKAQRLDGSLCTSIIVAAELRYGCIRKGSVRLTRKITQLLAELPVLPFDTPADQHYGDIRNSLEAGGQPIGFNDLLIAAHARSLDLILVTANTREFSRVPGLTIENWV